MLLPPIICVDYLHQFNRFMQILLTYVYTRQYYKLILWLLIVFIYFAFLGFGKDGGCRSKSLKLCVTVLGGVSLMQDDTCNDEFMWTGVFNVKITDTCIYLLKYVRELTHKLFLKYALKFTCKCCTLYACISVTKWYLI